MWRLTGRGYGITTLFRISRGFRMSSFVFSRGLYRCALCVHPPSCFPSSSDQEGTRKNNQTEIALRLFLRCPEYLFSNAAIFCTALGIYRGPSSFEHFQRDIPTGGDETGYQGIWKENVCNLGPDEISLEVNSPAFGLANPPPACTDHG